MVNKLDSWRHVSLGELVSFHKGGTLSKANLAESGIPCVLYGELYTRYAEVADRIHSRCSAALHELTLSKEEDVLLPSSGETPEEMAKATCIAIADVGIGGDIIIARPKPGVSGRFVSYQINRTLVSQVASIAQGNTIVHLNAERLASIQTVVPMETEQRAIARVLSGFNEHLENLDELIAKKKAIRDGALEELVTGRTRIAGYQDPWVEVSFEEAIQPKARIGWQGLKAEEYLSMGYSYLISGTDFNSGTIDFDNISFVSRSRYELDPNIQVRPGDVLVTKDGTIGKVARVPQMNKPATLNSGVFVFRPNAGLSKEFLYWVLMSPVFERFISTLAAGSTIKHLYQKDLKEFTFMAPPYLSEQTAIAEILSGASEEIRLLEEERAKVERLKSGAMNDLLTGRVRLPIEEKAA